MEKLAIVGTGIAGMGCGKLLHEKYDLSIYEQNDYVGGHTNTITLNEEENQIFVDTGFMVFNFQTYPNLCRLFDEIKAPIKKTDMSFSVQHLPTGLEYSGSGLNGLFAQRKNIFSTRHIKMLMQIDKFNSESPGVLTNPKYNDYSVAKYIEESGFSEDMLRKYLIPMSSAVWSAPMDEMMNFPIVTLVRFFKNHGFLGLNTQHQWYTIQNGSRSYRDLLIKPFENKIQTNNAVTTIRIENNKVRVSAADGSSSLVDKIILACHADQALKLIENPTEEQSELLSKFRYQKNIATLHTDESIMPKNKRVWSSWNYRIENKNGTETPSTIYWMNKLQQVSKNKNYFVSINPIPGSINENKILKVITYEHPLFDVDAMKAQDQLGKLNLSGPVYFCGSYFKYGFHEDAYASAVELCRSL